MLKQRKKNTRQRARTTHGWGSMKKHRGAGHRGGRGNAGSGKRGDAKKPSYWKEVRRKIGFTSHAANVKSINVGHLSSSALRLSREGLITVKAGVYEIDLKQIGYDHLLGGGLVHAKLAVTVKRASPRAVEKIKGAGGTVILLKTE